MEQGPGQPAQAPADRPRITTRYLTKYEKARVLGTRALQVREGPAEVWVGSRSDRSHDARGRLGARRRLPVLDGCISEVD